MARWPVVWLLCAMLVACGGGGGSASSPPTPTPTPTSQQTAAAQAAKLTAVLDTANDQATLTWADTFPAGTSYSIQQQAADGSWSSIDAVPGTTGTGSALTWKHTINTPTTLRVIVPETGYSVPLDTPSNKTSVVVTPPTAAPTISLNQAQPVSGNVTLSIGGGGTYSAVQWFVDLNTIGTSTMGPGYSIVLNASTLTAGPHLILAQLETSPDSYTQTRLQIQVQNPELTINATTSGTSGTVQLEISATSAYGITSVSAFLDGNSLGTLTAPNCSCVSGGQYYFDINATAAGSGPHTINVQATDGNGVSASQTLTVTFNNPPSLTLTTPFDGALVYGTLNIAGTFSSDKPGATVSVSATFGSATSGGVPVLNATSSPFSGNFSLAGVNPGTYTLTVIATDSTGLSTEVSDAVTVTSSQSLVYTPVLTLGQGGFPDYVAELLAASSPYMLYQDGSGNIHVHIGSNDTVLAWGPITDSGGGWAITDDGHVFVGNAFGSDRPSDTSIYMWPPGSWSSAPENLSVAAGSKGTYDELQTVHFPWILWSSEIVNVGNPSSNSSQYTLYNVTSGQTVTVPLPAGAKYVTSADFTNVNNDITVFYSVEGQAGSNLSNVYSWDQATGISTQLSSDGQSGAPQTDGTTVAWESPNGTTYTLTAENIASRSVVTLSTNMTSFALNDGLLAWAELSSNGTGQSIKAWNGSSISTITNLSSSKLFGSSGGFVAYQAGGQLYDWSPAGGSVLLFNGTPDPVLLDGSTLYFPNGASSQVLYAVPMQ